MIEYAKRVQIKIFSKNREQKIPPKVATYLAKKKLLSFQKIDKGLFCPMSESEEFFIEILKIDPENAKIGVTTEIQVVDDEEEFSLHRYEETVESVSSLVMEALPEEAILLAEGLEESMKKGEDNTVAAAPNKILIAGAPGSGKSFFAKEVIGRLCRKYGYRFFNVPSSALNRKYVGETSSAIYEIRQKLPRKSVLLLDECDSLLTPRTSYDIYPVSIEAVPEINRLLENIHPDQYIVIISNNSEIIDDSIRDRCFEIKFNMPSSPQLKSYVEGILSEFGLRKDQRVEMLLKNLSGKTFREARRLVMELYWEKLAKYKKILRHKTLGQEWHRLYV